MLRRIILLSALLASGSAAAGNDAPVLKLACTGPFAATATEADVVAAFGKENVVFKTVPGPEGTEFKATVVFPGDPAKELRIIWADEAKRARPSDIAISAAFVNEGETLELAPNAWEGPAGLKLGDGLEKLEQVNGKPFTFYGFGWDFGGFINSFEGGKLEWKPGDAATGGCVFSGRLLPQLMELPDEALGDRTLSSADAAAKAAKPVLSEMSIGYAVE